MAGIALTGSASGIGAATRELLEADGQRVIGVDLRDAEVTADLGTAEGRANALAGVLDACDHVLDGFAGFAGVPAVAVPPELLVTVSYFGAVAMLDGLRAALTLGGATAAIAVSSCAATVAPVDGTLVEACLAGDERGAVRRNSGSWAADGVRLNALAPGNTDTPLTKVTLDDPEIGPLMREIPMPIGRWAEPSEIASAARWMLSPGSSFMVGSVLFVDGGTDALVRPDTF